MINLKKLFSFILFFLCSLIFAETRIMGDISKIVFDVTGNPYIVEQDIFVPHQSEVAIQAGCVVLFKPFTGLSIEGSILVNGEKDKPVVFTAINDNDLNYIKIFQSNNRPSPFDWNGIYIAPDSKNVLLKNFILAYSVYSIKSKNDNIIFQNGILKENGYPITLNDKLLGIEDNVPFSYSKMDQREIIADDTVSQNYNTDSIYEKKEEEPRVIPVIQQFSAGEAILNIKTVPSEASIYLDGEAIEGKTPLSIDGVSSGKHIIKAVKGSSSTTLAIDAISNEITNLNITLRPQKTILKIISKPTEAEIYINTSPANSLKPDYITP